MNTLSLILGLFILAISGMRMEIHRLVNRLVPLEAMAGRGIQIYERLDLTRLHYQDHRYSIEGDRLLPIKNPNLTGYQVCFRVRVHSTGETLRYVFQVQETDTPDEIAIAWDLLPISDLLPAGSLQAAGAAAHPDDDPWSSYYSDHSRPSFALSSLASYLPNSIGRWGQVLREMATGLGRGFIMALFIIMWLHLLGAVFGNKNNKSQN